MIISEQYESRINKYFFDFVLRDQSAATSKLKILKFSNKNNSDVTRATYSAQVRALAYQCAAKSPKRRRVRSYESLRNRTRKLFRLVKCK